MRLQFLTTLVWVGLPALLASGCAGLSGLDAKGSFACEAPDGVTCMSVSGVYANSRANNLPGLGMGSKHHGNERSTAHQVRGASNLYTVDEQSFAGVEAQQESGQGQYRGMAAEYSASSAIPGSVVSASAPHRLSPSRMEAPFSGVPLRTPEKVLRIWLAPYQDQDGDLHDQKYFYVTIAPGEWTIEAQRANVRSRFRQVYPLNSSNPASGDDDAAATGGVTRPAGGGMPFTPTGQPVRPQAIIMNDNE